jgi:hypothetical protein
MKSKVTEGDYSPSFYVIIILLSGHQKTASSALSLWSFGLFIRYEKNLPNTAANKGEVLLQKWIFIP